MLLIFSRWLVMSRWLSAVKQQQQQDTTASETTPTWTGAGELAALDLTVIAVTTGLGDFVGTAILTALLHLAEGPR